MSFQLSEIQNDLRAAKLDGWLFYDFRGRDQIAHRILGLPDAMRTRRWFYFVPAKGTPKKLVHKIEAEFGRGKRQSFAAPSRGGR